MANPARYIPAQPPEQYNREIFWREFQKLREMADALADPTFDVKSAEPARPQAGMVRYADGVNWNPGAGEGLYVYDGMKWRAMANAGGRARRYYEGQL